MYVTKLPKLFSKKGYEVCIWQYECILGSSTVTHIENEPVTRLQFSKDDCVEARLTFVCLNGSEQVRLYVAFIKSYTHTGLTTSWELKLC